MYIVDSSLLETLKMHMHMCVAVKITVTVGNQADKKIGSTRNLLHEEKVLQ